MERKKVSHTNIRDKHQTYTVQVCANHVILSQLNEWVTQVGLDTSLRHKLRIQFSTSYEILFCSRLKLKGMKSARKLSEKTHFEDRDGASEMVREDAQFLEVTLFSNTATANQWHARSNTMFLFQTNIS